MTPMRPHEREEEDVRRAHAELTRRGLSALRAHLEREGLAVVVDVDPDGGLVLLVLEHVNGPAVVISSDDRPDPNQPDPDLPDPDSVAGGPRTYRVRRYRTIDRWLHGRPPHLDRPRLSAPAVIGACRRAAS